MERFDFGLIFRFQKKKELHLEAGLVLQIPEYPDDSHSLRIVMEVTKTRNHAIGNFQSMAIQMGGVLPYKWEEYCNTNGRCFVGLPFLQGLEARKVQRYKWGAHCCKNWRCTAVPSSRPVGWGF